MHGAHPGAAIGAVARKHNRHHAQALCLGQRLQQEIHRQTRARFRGWQQLQRAIGNGDARARRDHMQVIGPQRHAIGDFHHRKWRRFGQQIGQQRRVRRIKVLHQCISDAAARWQPGDQAAHRVQRTSGTANGNHHQLRRMGNSRHWRHDGRGAVSGQNIMPPAGSDIRQVPAYHRPGPIARVEWDGGHTAWLKVWPCLSRYRWPGRPRVAACLPFS